MNISPKISELNYIRNQEWSIPFTSDNSRQAIYAFNGDVYRGIDAYTISDDKLEKLQRYCSYYFWFIWAFKTNGFDTALQA